MVNSALCNENKEERKGTSEPLNLDSRRLRRRNFVKDLVDHYNKMSGNINTCNEISPVDHADVTVVKRPQRTKRMQKRNGIKDDTNAFQIASAKHRDSMNQIEPNIVKRRISEYNGLRSNHTKYHPSPIDDQYRENIFDDKEISFDLKTSSEGEDSEELLLEGNEKIRSMYEKHLKNGKKNVLKKMQVQADHQHLVSFYRKLFSKISQIPFAIAVTYCALFFIIQGGSIAYAFMYPS